MTLVGKTVFLRYASMGNTFVAQVQEEDSYGILWKKLAMSPDSPRFEWPGLQFTPWVNVQYLALEGGGDEGSNDS